MTTVQKIKEIEDEMARTQKNKATSYHLGLLKAKLAKLRRELITPQGGGGGGGGGLGFDVARTGIASVGFVGFPSVGKSTLMSKLTGTHSEAAAYEFTTLTTVPGTLKVHGAPIQILDLPGIVEGAADGRGRGRQVIAVARTCNLIFIVLDVLKPLGDKKVIETELEGFGIRLNKKPPQIIVRKKDKGGIAITNTVPLTNLDHESIKAVLSEFRISNADVAIREPDATTDDLIDVIEGGRVYVPAIYVLNKIDAISIEELDLLYKIPNSVPISSKEWMNIDELLEVMWTALDLVRVYTKPRRLAPDYDTPVVLRRGKSTVEDFCNSIHKEISRQMKYAVVWGSSAKHSRGQKVGLEHVLEDEDVIPRQLESTVMDADHEIALMYASSPWGLFQPRDNFYSPFSNVVLRVVQPPRPSLEDLLLQFFTGDEVTTPPAEPAPTEPQPQAKDEMPQSNDSTPNFDLSERIARELQEQEDREQEMRDRATALKNQFGEYMSIFGAPGSAVESWGPMFPREQVNAEAGPSTIKKPAPTFSFRSGSTLGQSKLYQDQKVTENNESSSDESDKISGKKPARASDFVTAGYSPSELLDNLEAHLRQEINQFDFPEQLEFQQGNHTPVLLHTPGLVKAGSDDVVERKSHIDGRIRRELGDLDRKVLETWAAKRRYSPVLDSLTTI
ncbi:unnamed protein product [Rhizoctonia solani]|uniref:Ribosome-interacting GTPase 1 n=1 Tax=Rhizoctonia solani TaxID=456999 RepID=A0A8H3D4E0_9AGAM|nr:unnamed protein product [Rhizoctonia solani]